MKLYGLIGYPLSHSFSKKYFTEKFNKEAIKDCLFELFPLKEVQGFPDLISNHNSLLGLAVTIPFKESILPYLHELDSVAQKIGAVNCISFVGSTMKGFNTDAIGFEQTFRPLLKLHHTKALVLGTGGSSKAVQYVLDKLNMKYLLVTSKSEKALGTVGYNEIDEAMLNQYTVIVNCTPVGMFPNEKEQPAIPYQFIGKNHLLYDLIYNPLDTLFLQNGMRQGATVKNGHEMLLIQAEENWRIWNA